LRLLHSNMSKAWSYQMERLMSRDKCVEDHVDSEAMDQGNCTMLELKLSKIRVRKSQIKSSL
jgi:hypothetical protein